MSELEESLKSAEDAKQKRAQKKKMDPLHAAIYFMLIGLVVGVAAYAVQSHYSETIESYWQQRESIQGIDSQVGVYQTELNSIGRNLAQSTVANDTMVAWLGTNVAADGLTTKLFNQKTVTSAQSTESTASVESTSTAAKSSEVQIGAKEYTFEVSGQLTNVTKFAQDMQQIGAFTLNGISLRKDDSATWNTRGIDSQPYLDWVQNQATSSAPAKVAAHPSLADLMSNGTYSLYVDITYISKG